MLITTITITKVIKIKTYFFIYVNKLISIMIKCGDKVTKFVNLSYIYFEQIFISYVINNNFYEKNDC